MSQQTPISAREYAEGLFNMLSKDRYLTDSELNRIETQLIKYGKEVTKQLELECARLEREKAELVKVLDSLAEVYLADAALAKEVQP